MKIFNRGNKKVVVYTSIYGNFEDLKEQIKQTYSADFVFFTNNTELEGQIIKGWKAVFDESIDRIPKEVIEQYKTKSQNISRLEAKYHKCNPHLIFPDYDIAIWIDGSAVIKTENFVSDMVKLLGKNDVLFFKHPERDNILDEAIFSKKFGKYDGFDLEAQAKFYLDKGMPLNSGLQAGGVIIRNNKSERLKQFNEDWWGENLKWSYQDQLSLQYLLWKDKIKYKVLDLNIWDNKYIAFMSHSQTK